MVRLFSLQPIPKFFKVSFLGVILFFNTLFPQNLGSFSFFYPSLLDVLKNPDHFFRVFQYEMDNFNPIYAKKYMPIEWRNMVKRKTDDIAIANWRYRFSASINVSSIAFSLFNYSFKVTALREDIYLPEIYLGFGHYFYIPAYQGVVSDPYKSILQNTSMHSFSGFLSLAKSLRQNVKLFGGYRLAYGFLEMDLPDDLPDYVSLIRSQDVDESWLLHDIFAGVSYLIPGSNCETLISVGFNPDLLLFGGKLEFLWKYVGLGLGYYANHTLLPIRPFLRVQYSF